MHIVSPILVNNIDHITVKSASIPVQQVSLMQFEIQLHLTELS